MFHKPITTASATKIADTVTALMSAGDPATAAALRCWFNGNFRGYRIEEVRDGKRIVGYKLTSSVYGLDLRETEVKVEPVQPEAEPTARKKAAPAARKKAAPAKREEGPHLKPVQGPREGWYAKLDAILPPVLTTDDQVAG